ncbi:hypothetical protein Efla_000989 [Eimeria flavescens]
MTGNEAESNKVRWQDVGVVGHKASGLCTVARLRLTGDSPAPIGPPSVDAFTFDGSSTVVGHSLLPSGAVSAPLESYKLSIAAAAAADCGVTALAAAEGPSSNECIALFAGLTNGQLWHVEIQSQRSEDNEHQRQRLRLSAASKQLLCCRMAEAVDAACCFVSQDPNGVTEAADQSSVSSRSLLVVVLYSDGAAVASWLAEGQTRELPLVEGGQCLSVSPGCDFIAITTKNRRLVIFQRCGKDFTVVKDFSPLKAALPGAPISRPAWLEEETLLLPGAARLRCIRKLNAWKETQEAPLLPTTGAPREFHMLQIISLAPPSEEGEPGRRKEAFICGVTTDGAVGVWKLQQTKPLIWVQCEFFTDMTNVCSIRTAADATCLLLLHSDGSLGILELSAKKLEEESRKGQSAIPPSDVKEHVTAVQKAPGEAVTPKQKERSKERVKEGARSASSVEAFLSRESAEAQSENTDNDSPADDLFSEAEPEEITSAKKEARKRSTRRPHSSEKAEGDSSSEESEGPMVDEMDDLERPSPADAEALAAGVSALESQLHEAQAMLNALLKKQREVTQRVIYPGGGPQPRDAGKPWCLFWTHLGHITKTVTADNSVLDVFNFAPGAAGDGTAHRKLADLQNCSMACLCRAGVILAAEGSSHHILEFRSFLDAGSWVKHFPQGEKIVAIAAGDAFVASLTEDRTLRIFTIGGILLYTADVFGRPVSLCASQQLLVVLTQTGSSNGDIHLHCSVLHVHPSPSSPYATFRLPISCFKRRLAAPPAAAACAPEVDIIHEGFFDVETPLDWVGISPGNMPAVKETSGIVRGLLPVAATTVGNVGYAFKWVKICSLAEASANAALLPIVVDEAKGELGVVRLKAGDDDVAFPDCSVSEPFFGYAMEHIPLRVPSPDLWSFPRWQRLLRQDKQLKGVGDGGGDAALVPWPQYDELRLQQEMALRQLNHFVSTCGGSSLGDAECETEAREAQRRLQLLTKRHDKYCLRGFAKCTDDKRLHAVAKEMALRLKTDNAPHHALSLLEPDTRLQAEKLKEELRWQEQQRIEFCEAAAAAATATSADTYTFQNENQSPRQLTPGAEKEDSAAHMPVSSSTTEKKSSIQKLLQWQQQHQQQRKSCEGGLASLFDGQKRQASKSGMSKPAKKPFFQKAD